MLLVQGVDNMTGTSVLKLDNGWGVDLLDGTAAVFSNRRHAEQFIVQQNCEFVIKKEDARGSTKIEK